MIWGDGVNIHRGKIVMVADGHAIHDPSDWQMEV